MTINPTWVAVIWLVILGIVLVAAWPFTRYQLRRWYKRAIGRRHRLPAQPVTRRATSVGEAVDELTRAGYGERFHSAWGGLVDTRARRFDPADLIVDEVYRFEGETDPGEEAAVFALRDADRGIRGTFVVHYGPGVDAGDAEIVLRLRREATRNGTAPNGAGGKATVLY